MTTSDLITLVQFVAPAVGVYAAIRADLAAMRVRVNHLERRVFGGQVNGVAE